MPISYTPPYSATGPWNLGGAPGINAAALNEIEGWILSVDQPASNLVTGTTAGSAVLYQFLTGTIKAFFMYYNGYRNASSTEQTILLPSAFTAYAFFFANGNIPQTHIYSGVSVINGKVNAITGLPVGGGAGSVASALNAMNAYSSGEIVSGFDHIGLGTLESITYTGGLFLIGI